MPAKNRFKKNRFNIPKQINDKLLQQANTEPQTVLANLQSSINGLNEAQHTINQEKYGNNTIGAKKQMSWYRALFDAVINPFSIILIAISVLNVIPLAGPLVNTNWISFGIIIGLLLITSSIKMFQELRSSRASEKLKEMVKTTTAVERNGVKKELPVEDLVPGDIVHLAAGDIIPADLLILNAKDLFITQSTLTGESEPVEKLQTLQDLKCKNALEANNLCFMGTSVSSGSAKGVVLATGANTFFGQVAKSITKRRPKTNFDKGIKSVSWMLIITMLIMTLVVFILQGSLHNSWYTAAIFGLALAIGLTPEMLPMVVTVNLAKQAFKLSKQKTIVKNINSIQSFGAMDVLCTDKTGTLTEDQIVLQRHINVQGIEDNRVLIYGFLNSQFQTGLKNLLDLAIIDKAKQKDFHEIATAYEKIDEIPFDFQRRRMSVVLKNTAGQSHLITKGAIEEILSICDYAEYKNKIVKLDDKLKKRVQKTVQSLNEEGMRVIAVATNHKPLPTNRPFNVQDENNLKLIGYIALLDPPKLSAKKAINDLQLKGVKVKVLTGDNDAVAKYIANKVGINTKRILLGTDIEDMTDEQLNNKVMNVHIFAKLSPEQKARIVTAIKNNKHVVGYMGDGINDATAMHNADISISVDTAVDIAKESADIILLEKDLTILGHGAIEGRKTYANIIKYIKMTVSSAFGNMLSMLVASVWLPFQPMLATQILILNLIYDFSQFAIPWDNVDVDFITKPRSWDAKSILKFMIFMGPVSSIFDITTFLIMFYVLKWNNAKDPTDVLNFQTGWFLVSLLTQTSVVIVLRTNHLPLIHSYPSYPVAISLMMLLLLGFMLVLVPNFDPIFNSLAFGRGDEFIGYSLVVATGYVISAQVAKKAYIKLFDSWL